MEGKVCIVTGGAGAIGREICVRLKEEGGVVYMADRDAEQVFIVVQTFQYLCTCVWTNSRLQLNKVAREVGVRPLEVDVSNESLIQVLLLNDTLSFSISLCSD